MEAQGLAVAKIDTAETNAVGRWLYPASGYGELVREINYAKPLVPRGVDGLTLYGWRTGSAIRPGHRRVAAEVLAAVGARAASARHYIAIEHLTGSSSARYAEMDVLAAQVDTMVEAHARAGHSRSVLEADDALEIACSRLASLDLIERDGNVRGALAIQATATEGYLYSASSREAASKHAKDEAKLRSALGERSFPSGGRGPKGKGKGDRGPDRERGSNGRGPQCYLCGGTHMIQDCPNLAAAQAAVRP